MSLHRRGRPLTSVAPIGLSLQYRLRTISGVRRARPLEERAPTLGTPSGHVTADTDYTAWGTSRLWAAVIVAVAIGLLMGLSAFARNRLRGGDETPRGGWFNGADNRWSTSKVSIVLWTIALLWAFVTLLIRYKGAAVPESVPATYLA